ncbi:hypothetical protein HY642_03080 [Candidatus Woesearchaeota archaeon]|nr:hypothetical protein [Candidatus Woesearchaeota archaeon]
MASLTISQAIDLWKTTIAGLKAGRHIESNTDAAYDGIWRAIIADIEMIMVALMLGRKQATSPRIYVQSVVPVARRVIADSRLKESRKAIGTLITKAG